MRIIGIVLACALVASANAANTLERTVDLNLPGALEQLKLERPTHYEAITRVLRVVDRIPCKNREVQSLDARFDPQEMACNMVLMTSDPPKRRLSFALEGTSYVIVVTLKDTAGQTIPAQEAD